MATRNGDSATGATSRRTLDPVTFEVLKNAFATSVNLMSEQILRTCYSFVIYSRDFSSALCDAYGNTVMQGDQDIAVHVGTLHFQCQAVLEEFGDDIHPGDVFCVNDPYAGGTHMNDVSFLRPIFWEGELLAFAQNKGHWADAGGTVPGSFDVSATDYFSEGLRITPIRVWSKGTFLQDIAKLLAANTRSPEIIIGDLRAQAEATAVCEREITDWWKNTASTPSAPPCARCRTTSRTSSPPASRSFPTANGPPSTTWTSTRPRRRASSPSR